MAPYYYRHVGTGWAEIFQKGSFSALRRVKTYLRSTMSQKPLTHIMLLHVHKDITAGLDLNIVLKEFVARSERRKNVFGKVV